MKKSKHSQSYQNININVIVTDRAKEQAKELGMWKRLQNKIEIFKSNPKHPSLHLEKLEPRQENRWSIRINDQYRVKLIKNNINTVTIYYVGDYHK